MAICPLFEKTMQLFVVVNGARLTSLLDSGLTHNFVDLGAAACADNHFGGRSSLQVPIANGDHVQSSGCCRNMPLSIDDEQFILDCYGLALASFGMVLGV
jgi:hypothetical protein